MADAALLGRLRDACAQPPESVAAVYLFGSVARGDDRAGSDLDVGVLGRTRETGLSPLILDDFCDRLEAAAGRNLDLVILQTAPPDLVHRVMRDGVLLIDRDRSRRIAFEVQARNEYFDLDPVRRQYRAAPRAAASRKWPIPTSSEAGDHRNVHRRPPPPRAS
jgi:predicted nucleotidyltransferase